MKKRVFSLLLAGALSMSLAACDGTGETSTTPSPDAAQDISQADGLKVGCVVKFQHEHFTAVMDGAKAAAEELGLEIDAQAPSSPTDVMGQVQLVEDMVTSGVDILLITANQPDTLTNIMDQAASKGTTIVAVDTDLPDYANKIAYVGTGNKNALKTAATELASRLPEGANVIVLRGPLGDTNHELRSEGAVEGLTEAGCNILEVFDAQSTAEKAAAATEDFLLKYQSQGVDAILCCDDEMAVGAVTAIKQAGKLDTIQVSGYDGNQAAVELVGAGELTFTMAQNPYQMGYQAVMNGYHAHMGESFDSEVDTGVQLITQENYQEFLGS